MHTGAIASVNITRHMAKPVSSIDTANALYGTLMPIVHLATGTGLCNLQEALLGARTRFTIGEGSAGRRGDVKGSNRSLIHHHG